MSSRLHAAVCVAACLATAACAGAAPATPSLTFPTGATAALASTTLYTSPDGGIYQNPDPLQVLMVTRQSAAPVMHRLGAAASSWSALQQFGDFTYVGVAIANHGQAGSDPQLNLTQIASDFAPAAADAGPLRRFYHPMFPLAMLSMQSSDSQCGVHIDPGHRTVVVLLYAPITSTSSIVWGAYQAFALRVPLGGRLPRGSGGWRATACVPPQAAPAAGP